MVGAVMGRCGDTTASGKLAVVSWVDVGQPLRGLMALLPTIQGRLGIRYWQMWTAAAVSSVGDGLIFVAFPLLAASMTRDPRLVSGVVFAQNLPWLLLSLPGGALADRLERLRLMGLVDVVRGGVVVVAGVLVASGRMTIPLLYLMAFALGSLETAFMAAAHAALPSLVSRDRLQVANGYLWAAQTGGEDLIGPPIGAALFAAAASLPLFADGATFALSAVVLLLLARRRAAVEPRQDPHNWGGLGLKPALSWFMKRPLLMLLSGVVGFLALFQAMVTGVLVLLALERLHLSPTGYGLLLAGAAVGDVVGALVAARLDRIGASGILTGAAIIAALAYLLLGSTSSPVMAGLILGVESLAVACGSVTSTSLRQRVVPDELLGRIGNVFRTVIWGAIPVGALLGGVLGHRLGLRAPLLVAGGGQILLAVLTAGPLHRLVRDAGETRPVLDLTGSPSHTGSHAAVGGSEAPAGRGQ